MKKLKIIIVIFVIAILFIIGGIILLRNDNTEPSQDTGDIEETIVHANEMKDEEDISDGVKNSESFFTVSSCVSQYLNLLNKNYDIYYGYDDNNNYTQIINPYENILEVLSKKYIKENNISKDSLQNYVQLMNDKVIFVPLQMRVTKNSDIETYLVYGIISSISNEYIDDIYLFVNLDEINSTFSIVPIKGEYDNIYDIDFTNEEDLIEPNDFNKYVPIVVNSEYMCKQYLNAYKNIALAKPEMAYQLLDKEYREERFGDLSSYIKYMEDNRKEIATLQLNQYLVNGYNEYIEYVCRDRYQNLYVFRETGIMDFTLKLDTYTIPTEKFTTTYSSANVQRKVMMNVDKWVQMLNNRDYTAAYNVLDETFRNNNFGSEEKFETYMRTNYPLHYQIKFSSFSEEGITYVQHITLIDINSEDGKEKELDIIMKLKDGIDFVMSFSIE